MITFFKSFFTIIPSFISLVGGLLGVILLEAEGIYTMIGVLTAFVHAVYPADTELNDGVFVYNNTPKGYQLLAKKETDIFLEPIHP